MTPEAFSGADKLICCEVLTPDGNPSSYPPHKHDDSDGSPVCRAIHVDLSPLCDEQDLEEIALPFTKVALTVLA